MTCGKRVKIYKQIFFLYKLQYVYDTYIFTVSFKDTVFILNKYIVCSDIFKYKYGISDGDVSKAHLHRPDIRCGPLSGPRTPPVRQCVQKITYTLSNRAKNTDRTNTALPHPVKISPFSFRLQCVRCVFGTLTRFIFVRRCRLHVYFIFIPMYVLRVMYFKQYLITRCGSDSKLDFTSFVSCQNIQPSSIFKEKKV